MIGRKTVVIMANTLVSAILGLLALKLTARYFGPDHFGEVEYAVGLLGMGYLITDLGMGHAHQKRVSEGRHAGDCFATYAVFKLTMTAIFAMGSAAVVGFYILVLEKPIESTTPAVLFIVLAYYVAKTFQEIAQATFEARLETARAQATTFTETVVRVGLTVMAAIGLGLFLDSSLPGIGIFGSEHAVGAWVRDHASEALAITWMGGAVTGAVVAISYGLRILEDGRFRWELLKDYATFAFPLFLVTATAVISSQIDRAALGFFGSSVDTGIFSGFRKIGFLVAALGGSVGALLFPTFSGLAARGEHGVIHSHMDRSLRYLSMMMVPATAFMMIFPAQLGRILLDERWVGSAHLLSLLALYGFLVTMALPYSMLILGLGRPDLAARIGITAALVNIVFNLVLIPDDIRSLGIRLAGLGTLGAALATLLSGIVYYVYLKMASAKLTGYRSRTRFWIHWIAGAVMVFALLGMDGLGGAFALTRWYHLIIYPAVGAAVFGLALVLMRELTREDMDYVKGIIHPGELIRYLRSELGPRKKGEE